VTAAARLGAGTKHSIAGATTRARTARQRRLEAADLEQAFGFQTQEANGDQALSPALQYSKGLPHDENGEPQAGAFRALSAAMRSGRIEDFEAVPLGGYVRLSDPQAAFAYDLIGPDGQQIAIPPPPRFSSAEQAAEMVEMYWRALLRDIPLDEYDSHPLAAKAAAEMDKLAGYRGPRANGKMTPATLFRGTAEGALAGPHVSQFLWRDLPWTPIRVPQRIRTAAPKDYVVTEEKWLAVQNGAIVEDTEFASTPTYIRTGRDLAEYVHRDFTYQAFLGACMMLFKMSAPVDGGIPYQYSVSQSGFVTFGPSDIFHLVAVVANIALKAAWYQKWLVHMRIRPEEYGGRVHKHLGGIRRYPLHLDLLNSAALELTRARFGTALLPLAYPEGAPTHPSFPAGHAVVAGACATVLKACFSESFVIPGPVVPSPDGQSLRPWKGPDLTVGHEVDKLAWNIALARDFAGLHWRSDHAQGLLLGEAVAINILREMRLVSHELFTGFDLTRFDQTRITIR